LVATRRTTSPSSQGCDVIHNNNNTNTFTYYLMHTVIYPIIKQKQKQNQIKIVKRKTNKNETKYGVVMMLL
jgi:hypothetical protein